MAAEKRTRIVFIGDSITDCGRRSHAAPLGDGYVKFADEFLAIRKPARKFHLVNKGISGHTILLLEERWTDDVIRQNPDVLVMMIGINDIYQTLSGVPPIPVPPERYGKVYDEVIARTAEKLPRCRIILLEPFYITKENSPSTFRYGVLEILPKYLAVVHNVARKYRCTLVRTQQAFEKLLKHHEPEIFCPEPVHPNRAGHLVIAEEVYAALERNS